MLQRSVFGLCILLLSCAVPAEPPYSGTRPTSDDALRELHETLLSGMRRMHELPMSGNTDHDFVAIMIHQYEVSIALARIQLRNSKDGAVRDEAERLVTVNERAITDLRKLATALTSGRR